MSRLSRQDLFIKFFGVTPDDDASILGVDDRSGNAAIISALQRRLATLSEHADANSFDADEVRLTLHAAAARLLEMHIQQPGSGAAADRGPVPGSVEADVFRTLAMSGGWNRRALHKIMVLAGAEGLPPAEVVRLVQTITGQLGAAPPVPRKNEKKDAAVTPGPSLDAMPRTPHPTPANTPARTSASRFSAPDLPAEPAIPVAKPSPEQFPDYLLKPEPPPREVFSLPEQADPSRRLVRNAIIGIGAGLVLLAMFVTALILFASNPSPQPKPATGSVTPAPAPQGSAPNPANPAGATAATASPPAGAAQAKPVLPLRIGDFQDRLRTLGTCVEGLAVDQDKAVVDFEKVYAQVASEWTNAPPDAAASALNQVIEFVYRTAGTASAAQVARIIAAPLEPPATGSATAPESVAQGAWAAGVLARLSRERDLPMGTRRIFRDAWERAMPGTAPPAEATFNSGAIMALGHMPLKLVAIPAADVHRAEQLWAAWMDALHAVAADTPLADHTMIVALEEVMTQAPEPTSDPAVYQAQTTLTLGLSWRAGEDSRRALIRWFDSPAVSNADLNTVTRTLAEKSGAAQVDISMVLSLAGGDPERAALRDRYANVWGLSTTVTRDAYAQSLIDAARAILDEPAPDPTPHAQAEYAIRLARLNAAAQVIWASQNDRIGNFLEPAKGILGQGPAPSTPAVATPSGSTLVVTGSAPAPGAASSQPAGTWGLKYLSCGPNVNEKKAVLASVSMPPTLLEAAILVEEGCRGSNAAIRSQARILLSKYASEPAVARAMLDFAPLMPAIADNSELVERIAEARLPSVRSPDWRVAVRRALVERVLQILSSGGELAYADTLEKELARAYEARAGAFSLLPSDAPQDDATPPPTDDEQTREKPAPAVERSAVLVRAGWRRQAEQQIATGREPISLQEISARRAQRLSLASGRVQTFVAEQSTICEYMAYVIVAERADRRADVAQVLDDWTGARRSATDITRQIAETERAMLRLWLIRWTEGAS